MAKYRRSATFDAVLVYFDEPQIITLISQKTRVIALAIPDEDASKAMFHGTIVSEKDWVRYLNGKVDLRYLFTFPLRTHYKFDLHTVGSDKKLLMSPWQGDVDEKFLPPAKFFSYNHNVDYEESAPEQEQEMLVIDGEWELTDFGQFQQKYSDLYVFVTATRTYSDDATNAVAKKKIKDAFQDRPFQGGFSYVHLFDDLNDNVPPEDQLNLKRIKYASPGEVEIFGKEEIFVELQNIIPNFLAKREKIGATYNQFYKYLSKSGYLKLSGNDFSPDDPGAAFIKTTSETMANDMLAPDFNTVWTLTDQNALVAAKIVMAFYRRLADASMYFAQGRVSYPD